METKMLRWTAGVTRMDHIRNDAIQQKFGVAPIADKMREAHLLHDTATCCVERKTASGRESDLDNDRLRQLVESDPRRTTRELAQDLRVQ
ncbi:unnamed protein product [Heligmosomoides polygyrus]|uniref:HTH_48 domain-containing protein n=1 Tax=Heligmosomoides polygyrus TaxID=6339 RepID=A0A183FD50_HELPZ|nr:unnamed protein product [Heligmosomoides polygyrus]